MTEVYNRAVCWVCDGNPRLVKTTNVDTWQCEKCREAYFQCSMCKDPPIFEAMETANGWDCSKCGRYFCCSCFQHTGDASATDEWICDSCSKLARQEYRIHYSNKNKK